MFRKGCIAWNRGKHCPETVRNKIMKHAFSGGRQSLEEHRKMGGVPEVDVSYQYLTYFLEDSNKLKKIYEVYKSGKILTGELKEITVDVINKFLAEHQKKRENAKNRVEEFKIRD